MVAIRTLTGILTYLIGLCGILPLFPWLSAVPRLALIAGMLVGVWQELRGNWSVKNWMQNCLVVPFFIYYAVQFSRANPIQPVISLLAIMLALRLAGQKNIRHSLQIQALSLFCLASSSLFDLSPLFLGYLALLLLLVALALVLLTFLDQDENMLLSRSDLKKVLLAGILMPLLSLPLLLLFFPLLPRTQMPLWNFLNSPVVRSSGFSDKVEPGVQSEVGTSRGLVFRAELPQQPRQQLYWRGTVFNRLQGNRWIRDGQIPTERLAFNGLPIEQVIYPEPSLSRVLIALDRPQDINLSRLKRSPDGVAEYLGPAGKRLAYRVASSLSDETPVSGKINRDFYLALPDDISPHITKLATDIVRRAKSDNQKLELLETYFRNGGFRYSMRGLPTGQDALEQFLFKSRQGHCEFFASALAVLLRSTGVPSRVVGGFLGGDYNQLGGYYLVNEDRAHVWVEALIEGSGWRRVDPSALASNADEVWSGDKSRSFLLKLRMTVDYLNYLWNRSVVVYDLEQQFELVRRAGKKMQGLEPSRIVRSAIHWLAFSAILIYLYQVMQRGALFKRREERILRHFLCKVERDCGIDTRQGQTGLFEISEMTGNEAVCEFVEIYGGAVYRDRRLSDDEYRRLRQIVREGFRNQ